MKIFWLVFVMFIYQIPASAQSPPPQAAGYTLVWDQEFSALDLSPDNTGNHDWDSCISSIHTAVQTHHAFRYGYFEASMKWDNVTGSWPAFWMDSLQEVQQSNPNHEYG